MPVTGSPEPGNVTRAAEHPMRSPKEESDRDGSVDAVPHSRTPTQLETRP
jgi:hypothetical protein